MARAIDADALLNEAEYDSNFRLIIPADKVKNAPTLTPPNEWGSVKERLPDKHGEYIVCACDEGEPIDERIWGDTVVICADYYDGTFTWYEGNTEYDISDIVTHWMPLPAPPDKGNNVLAKTPNESLTLEHLRASPHGKIKDSTLQSICNRANEIACRPPEGEANA